MYLTAIINRLLIHALIFITMINNVYIVHIWTIIHTAQKIKIKIKIKIVLCNNLFYA